MMGFNDVVEDGSACLYVYINDKVKELFTRYKSSYAHPFIIFFLLRHTFILIK